MASTNDNLATVISLLTEIRDNAQASASDTGEKLGNILTATFDVYAVGVENRELLNSLLYQTTLIQEWDMRTLTISNQEALMTTLGVIDNNLSQLKTGWANFGWPMLENIFYAVNDSSISAISSSECFDCDRPPLLPAPTGLPPADENLHCQRIQYYITTLRDTFSEFIDRYTAGLNISTSAAQVLLLTGVIPGIDVATIPAALIAAVVSFGGAVWREYLNTILDALTNHYDELVTALYEANNSGEASDAWNAWVDEYIPLLTNPAANILAKIWGNSLFMNTLYDQATYDWPGATGFDETICGIEPETFTTIISVMGLTATSPGSLATQVEDVRPWIELTLLCDAALSGPTGWSCYESGYVEGDNINTLPRFEGFCEDNLIVNRRYRKVGSGQTISFYSPSTPEIELTEDWYEVVDALGDNWRLVGEIGGAEFEIQAQKLVGGVWQALF